MIDKGTRTCEDAAAFERATCDLDPEWWDRPSLSDLEWEETGPARAVSSFAPDRDSPVDTSDFAPPPVLPTVPSSRGGGVCD